MTDVTIPLALAERVAVGDPDALEELRGLVEAARPDPWEVLREDLRASRDCYIGEGSHWLQNTEIGALAVIRKHLPALAATIRTPVTDKQVVALRHALNNGYAITGIGGMPSWLNHGHGDDIIREHMEAAR